MDKQTKVNGRNGASNTDSHGLAWDVGSFANDTLTLTELQTQLLAADVKEFGRQVWAPSLVMLGGLALALACFPIALVTLALGLVQLLETSYFIAFLIVLAVGAISSLLLCLFGWIKIRERAAVLQRSRDELMRNLSWIKRVLTRTRFT